MVRRVPPLGRSMLVGPLSTERHDNGSSCLSFTINFHTPPLFNTLFTPSTFALSTLLQSNPYLLSGFSSFRDSGHLVVSGHSRALT